MRVLICGGRFFRDFDLLHATMMQIDPRKITLVIHGGAPGADSMADRWARWIGLPVMCFPAKWQVHGSAAGPIRNQQMIDEGKPDLVVAMPGGRGTADMVNRAKKNGTPVVEVNES